MSGKMGSFKADDFKELAEKLQEINERKREEFVKSCIKELAARLLRAVIRRTPVGDYSEEVEVTAKRDSKKHKKGEKYKKKVNKNGKQGGTLKRGWTATKSVGSEGLNKGGVKAYADSITVHHFGDIYVVNITNPVEYASYVEYGHRLRNGKYYPGKFMLTISEQELRRVTPAILESKIKKFLEENMK